MQSLGWVELNGTALVLTGKALASISSTTLCKMKKMRSLIQWLGALGIYIPWLTAPSSISKAIAEISDYSQETLYTLISMWSDWTHLDNPR
jgi:hypothetical protein